MQLEPEIILAHYIFATFLLKYEWSYWIYVIHSVIFCISFTSLMSHNKYDVQTSRVLQYVQTFW